MPHKTAPSTPRQKAAARAAKTRKILQGSNIQDSSDEDEDDQPWEWIYDKTSKGKAEVEGSDEESADEDDDTIKTPRKRKARNVKTYVGGRIIGARKGRFTCRVGDTVLVRSDGAQTWVAMIWRFCEMEDEDGAMVKGAEFLCRLFHILEVCLANGEQGSMTRKRYIIQSKRRNGPISFQYVP